MEFDLEEFWNDGRPAMLVRGRCTVVRCTDARYAAIGTTVRD